MWQESVKLQWTFARASVNLPSCLETIANALMAVILGRAVQHMLHTCMPSRSCDCRRRP